MLMTITSKLEGIETRLTAVEGGKTDTPQSEAESGLPANVNTANDESSDDDDDKQAEDGKSDDDDKKEHAMDAKTVEKMIAAAVASATDGERKRAAGVEAAKRAVRADLGDAIALDSEADIYRAALKQRGVTDLPEGADLKATYMAIKSATTPSRVTLANDSSGDNKPSFDTSRIRNLGRA